MIPDLFDIVRTNKWTELKQEILRSGMHEMLYLNQVKAWWVIFWSEHAYIHSFLPHKGSQFFID